MDLIIVGLVILIVLIGIGMVILVREKLSHMEHISPEKNWMVIGIIIGVGIGMPIGLVLGILMENVLIGVGLGLLFGAGIGTAIGSFIEKKHDSELLHLPEKEKQILRIATLVGIVLFSIGLVLLAISLIKK